MKFNIISKDNNTQKMKVVFDFSDTRTCMKQWLFDIEEDENGKKIVDSNIQFGGQGCMGHPKTISALIKNANVKNIDTLALSDTSCFQNQSCGMNLGVCVKELLTNPELQF